MVLIDMCWGQPWMSKDVLEQMGHLGPGTGWWCSQTMLRTNLDIQVSPRTDGPQGIIIWESHHNNNSRHLGRPWYSLWTYCHSLLLWIFKVVPDHFKIQDVPERSLRLYNFEEGTSPPPPHPLPHFLIPVQGLWTLVALWKQSTDWGNPVKKKDSDLLDAVGYVDNPRYMATLMYTIFGW